MDAHRLCSVIDSLVKEQSRLEIDRKLERIQQTLDACVATPSPASDEHFRNALGDLQSVLRDCRTNDFVESHRRIVRAIEGDQVTGEGLARRLEVIADERPFLPARAKEELAKLAQELERYLETLSTARDSLFRLKVGPAERGVDEYELGILLSESVAQGDLACIVQEMKDWDRILKEFFPLITAKRANVSMRSYSSGNFELSIGLDRDGALALGTIIGGVYQMFRKVKANRAKAEELAEQNYPAEILSRMKQYEQQLVQREMKAIKESIKAHHLRTDVGRPKEREKALERGLRFLARRIREGVELELLGPSTPGAEIAPTGEERDEALTHHVRSALQAAARSPREPIHQKEKPRHMQLSQIASESGEADEAKPKAA